MHWRPNNPGTDGTFPRLRRFITTASVLSLLLPCPVIERRAIEIHAVAVVEEHSGGGDILENELAPVASISKFERFSRSR